MKYATIIYLEGGADPDDYTQADVVALHLDKVPTTNEEFLEYTIPGKPTNRMSWRTVLQCDIILDKKEQEETQKKYANKQPEKLYFWKATIETPETPTLTKHQQKLENVFVTSINKPGNKPIGRTIIPTHEGNAYWRVFYLADYTAKIIISRLYTAGGRGPDV